MITLRRKSYSNTSETKLAELGKSYIPYEEQKKRKRRTNEMTAAGLGATALAAGGYYTGKTALVNSRMQRKKNKLVQEATNALRKNENNYVKNILQESNNLNESLQNTKGIFKGFKRRRLVNDFLKKKAEADGQRAGYIQGLEDNLKKNFKTLESRRASKLKKVAPTSLAIAAAGTGLTLAARKYKKNRDKEL